MMKINDVRVKSVCAKCEVCMPMKSGQ